SIHELNKISIRLQHQERSACRRAAAPDPCTFQQAHAYARLGEHPGGANTCDAATHNRDVDGHRTIERRQDQRTGWVLQPYRPGQAKRWHKDFILAARLLQRQQEGRKLSMKHQIATLPLWMDSVPLPSLPRVERDDRVDVV